MNNKIRTHNHLNITPLIKSAPNITIPPRITVPAMEIAGKKKAPTPFKMSTI